jgi:hypothetical protein
MRTTIDIPDKLIKQVKMKAIEEGLSLKEFFIKALHKELHSDMQESSKSPWKELQGLGVSNQLNASESGFEDYQGPDLYSGIQVNEPS